jgi:hypothetical protein
MEIYLDDYHLHSTTQRLHTMVKRPLPGLEGGEPRITVYNNPGEAGQTVSQILAGASLITLSGSLTGINGATDQERLDDYATARLELLQAITFEYGTDSRILPRTLRITMPNGSEYQATVYRNNWQAPVEYNTYGTWLLELLNPSGILESQTETVLTTGLPQPGGVLYPIVYPVIYGATTGGSVTATNYGDAEAKPLITLYGPMENPVITNQTTGKYLRLNMTIDSGRKVEINMARPSIMEGPAIGQAINNRQDKKATGSSFWRIKPRNNVIKLRAAHYDTGYVTISFRSAYTGL